MQVSLAAKQPRIHDWRQPFRNPASDLVTIRHRDHKQSRAKKIHLNRNALMPTEQVNHGTLNSPSRIYETTIHIFMLGQPGRKGGRRAGRETARTRTPAQGGGRRADGLPGHRSYPTSTRPRDGVHGRANGAGGHRLRRSRLPRGTEGFDSGFRCRSRSSRLACDRTTAKRHTASSRLILKYVLRPVRPARRECRARNQDQGGRWCQPLRWIFSRA